MGRIKSFNRREQKFIIKTEDMQPFIDDIAPYLQKDRHTGPQGFYRIVSMYYDSPEYAAYWQKMEGTKHRRKLRLRVYGDNTIKPHEECFLEIKERVDLAVRKRRIIIPYQVAIDFCKTGVLDEQYDNEEDRAVIDEMSHLIKLFRLQPAVILRYDRIPYNGSPEYDPSLRITFDVNCRARIHDLDLGSSPPEDMTFFLSPQLCILEIKADDRVPYWLVEKLHKHRFVLNKISKYCTALSNLKLGLERPRYILPSVVKETPVPRREYIPQPKEAVVSESKAVELSSDNVPS
jgi:hypothetical protein